MSFIVIIPARYQSSRFPGKPLVDIHGKPMVQHVYEKSVKAGALKTIVATDDERIEKAVKAFDGEVCMTRSDHESGTERLAEVVEKLQLPDDQIVVNVQGDEPFIPAENIRQVADNLAQSSRAKMATLSVAITEAEEVLNPNAVKVVTDNQGYALYFSRATIPYDRDRFMVNGRQNTAITEVGDFYQRHIGIYAYSAGFIKEYVQLDASPIEQIESLEQLRVLWHGFDIHVAEAKVSPPAGIDTPEDLKAAIGE